MIGFVVTNCSVCILVERSMKLHCSGSGWAVYCLLNPKDTDNIFIYSLPSLEHLPL